MNIKSDVLIIGAGYSGLIISNQIKKYSNHEPILLDKGYNHAVTGNDYIVLLKDKYEFTSNQVNVITKRISSGSEDFTIEYSKKVFNKKIDLKIFTEEKEQSLLCYEISQSSLLNNSNIYGNVVVNKIDTENKIVHGRVLHLNEDVSIKYNILISTLPIHKFSKFIGVELLRDFDIFISYFPVGVKRRIATTNSNDMLIKYYSDSNVPFYRTHHYKRSIFYEYCLNKPYMDRFDSIILPGKFIAIDDAKMDMLYQYMSMKDVFLAGRYSIWNPNFILDHLIHESEYDFIYSKHINEMYRRIL